MTLASRQGGLTGPMAPVFVEGFGDPGTAVEPSRVPGSNHEPPPHPEAPEESPGEALAAPKDPRLLLRHLGRESAHAIRVSRVGIWRFADRGSSVLLVTRYNRGDASVEEDREYSEGLASSLWSLLGRVRALTVDDTTRSADASEPFREWITRDGVRAVLALPVRVGARLVGFVSFEEGRSPRSWTPRDRDLAASLAEQIADPLTRLPPRRADSPVAVPDPGHPAVAVEDPWTARETEAGTEPLSSPLPDANPATATASEARRLAPATAPVEARARTPDPEATSADSHRRKVRRLPRLQGAAIVGAEEMVDLTAALDVQEGYLALLEEVTADRPDDQALVLEARDASRRLRTGLYRFLGCLQEGIPERREMVLNRLLPAMIPSLSREAGPDIRLRIAPTSRTLRVEVNAPLLERAVTHLVRNAREASGPGEDIRISWGPATHGDPGVRESDWARIRVGDRGVGIERKVLPWLFEPFFSNRSDGSAFRGLGLPLVQAVVEGHGGWVEVRSTQGEGTEVDLFLPLLTTRDTAGESGPSDGASTRGEGRVPRILLLEDEPLLARLIRRVLMREGYLVDVVETPADAEPGMREYRDSVDLLIVEKELTGGVSGIELAEGWRSVRPGLAVVVLDRQGARDSEGPAGGDSIGDLPLIRRPFEPADLLVRVREALRPPPEVQNPASGDAGPSGSPPVEGIGGERGKDLTH